jgi:hypothetical protein
MTFKTSNNGKRKYVRIGPRIYSVKDISVCYKGRTENVANRPPDVSTNGMFVNTSQRFPEGAVLNLRFRLAISEVEIRTRSEVRYCLPGVGVGVEFVGISPDAVRKIEREVQLCSARAGRPRKTEARSRLEARRFSRAASTLAPASRSMPSEALTSPIAFPYEFGYNYGYPIGAVWLTRPTSGRAPWR